MKVKFLKVHTLKENRKTYKIGDTETVSTPLGKRLKDAGLAEEVTVRVEPKIKESK